MLRNAESSAGEFGALENEANVLEEKGSKLVTAGDLVDAPEASCSQTTDGSRRIRDFGERHEFISQPKLRGFHWPLATADCFTTTFLKFSAVQRLLA